MFKRVGNTRIAQRVAEEIVRAIQEQQYREGSKLPGEVQLAGQFGVSRTCIREALRILEAMDIVKVEQGKGCLVRSSTGGPSSPTMWTAWLKAFRIEVLALLEVREAIEEKCSSLAAQRRTDEQVQEMERLLDDTRRVFQLGQMTPEQAFVFDSRFHEIVARASGNPFMLRLSAGIGGALETDRMATMSIPGRIERSIHEHNTLLQAIKARRPEEAARLTVKHIREVAEDIASLSSSKS